MHLQDILNLYEYNYWANDRILGIVQTLPHEEFIKDRASSHGGIHGTLHHTMGAEEIWLKRWKGESPASFHAKDEFPTFDKLTNHWEMVEMEMMGFCHMLKSDQDIARVIEYKDLKGNQYKQVLHHLMQHLVNHSTYHRGQIVTMLRQAGVKPVSTDLVAFYRERS